MIHNRIMLVACMVMSGLFIACSSRPEILTEAAIKSMFEDLKCETESLVISHQPMAEHEHLEMVFLQENHVQIHKLYTAPASVSTYDYQLMFTLSGVYDTRTMQYRPYDRPLETKASVMDVAQEALDFFEEAFIDCDQLLARVLELEHVTSRPKRSQILVEGRIPGSAVGDIEAVYQILIDNDKVVEIQWIKRYDTSPSKKESHVIASTRVNRNVIEPPDFPSFDSFQEVE